MLESLAGNGDSLAMRYPGGKGRNFQQLINLMPPHEVYIETHVGGGAVLRNKKPARQSVAIDMDMRALEQLKREGLECEFVCADAVEYLKGYDFAGDELIFCDPPYIRETRRSRRRIYACEYDRSDHVCLLEVLTGLSCPVIITSYDNDLYRNALAGWKVVEFKGASHVGSRTELAWLNFQPGAVHDTDHLGQNFRKREAFRRKRKRWLDRFSCLSVAEQQAILADLSSAFVAKAPFEHQFGGE